MVKSLVSNLEVTGSKLVQMYYSLCFRYQVHSHCLTVTGVFNPDHVLYILCWDLHPHLVLDACSCKSSACDSVHVTRGHVSSFDLSMLHRQWLKSKPKEKKSVE